MQKMRLVLIIPMLLLLFAGSGCSLVRRSATVEADAGETGNIVSYSNLVESNIGVPPLFIRRIRGEAYLYGERTRFSANLRANSEGEWLLSIRSILGIEVARIFAGSEGVVLLDRLANIAERYSWNEMANRYGVRFDMIGLLLGDIPANISLASDNIDCDRPLLLSARTGPGYRVHVDCNYGKVRQILVEDAATGSSLTVTVERFTPVNGSYYPFEITVEDDSGTMRLTYRIDDIVTDWTGSFNFAIPSNYTIVR